MKDGKLCIIEDNDADFDLMLEIFPERFASIERAKDGEEALTLIGKEYDLFIVDLNIPKIHGFEVLKSIIERPFERSSYCVAVISTSDREHDKQRAMDIGADYYVIKSVKLSEFIDNISVIKTKKNRQESP